MTSPLAKCLVTSNFAAECGKILESLIKEKKQKRYSALKTSGNCLLSHNSMILCSKSIDTIFEVFGWKTALIFRDLMYKQRQSVIFERLCI